MLAPIFFLISLFASGGTAVGLEVKKTVWKGREALLITGAIQNGDTERVATALASLKPAAHGHRLVLLTSPGGSVTEALGIASVFKKASVHTIIPEGGHCASACASILFISGVSRTVEEGGLLGQHSCSRNGVPDPNCNELIAQHALENGISHGAIAAFVTYAAPKDMVWFDRTQADCWGLTKYPFSDQSGFEKSEPCFFKIAIGRFTPAQSAWRVDFHGNGYRAFLRPGADHLDEMELNIFCREESPARLFLSMTINGPPARVRAAISSIEFAAPPVNYRSPIFDFTEIGEAKSRIIVEIRRNDIRTFIAKAEALQFNVFVNSPFQPLRAQTTLRTSRAAITFVANNCASSA